MGKKKPTPKYITPEGDYVMHDDLPVRAYMICVAFPDGPQTTIFEDINSATAHCNRWGSFHFVFIPLKSVGIREYD